MSLPPEIEAKLLKLRRDFDESFATVPASRVTAVEDLLGFRIGGDAYALRMKEITGFVAAGRIVPLPARVPQILGLAAVRGALVPAVSLAGLLGYARESDAVRWLALSDMADPVAFALGEFEGYLRVLPSEACTPDKLGERRGFIEAAVRSGDRVRSILSVPSMVNAIKNRAGDPDPGSER